MPSEGVRPERRECEFPGCGVERARYAMRQAPDGSWYCPTHFKRVNEDGEPADVVEQMAHPPTLAELDDIFRGGE